MKKLIIIAFVLLSVFSAFAFESSENLLPLLSADELAALKNGSPRVQYENLNSGFYCKDGIMLERCEHDLAADNCWSVGLTCFIPYPENMAAMSDEEKLIYTYNKMKAISTQKGITYISYTNGEKPAVLFKDAYLISDPTKKSSRIDDPVIDTLPPQTETCYSFQKDSKFGDNVYTLTYKTSQSEIYLDINNYTAMKYMGFKCLDNESLSLCVDAQLASDGIIVSGLATIKGQERRVKALVVTVDLPTAFMKRLTSLKNWFIDTI